MYQDNGTNKRTDITRNQGSRKSLLAKLFGVISVLFSICYIPYLLLEFVLNIMFPGNLNVDLSGICLDSIHIQWQNDFTVVKRLKRIEELQSVTDVEGNNNVNASLTGWNENIVTTIFMSRDKYQLLQFKRVRTKITFACLSRRHRKFGFFIGMGLKPTTFFCANAHSQPSRS